MCSQTSFSSNGKNYSRYAVFRSTVALYFGHFNAALSCSRGLDKEMRAWDTYTGVESTVKNMITSLKAVGELQNPAIRERHWDQLMAATGVRQ